MNHFILQLSYYLSIIIYRLNLKNYYLKVLSEEENQSFEIYEFFSILHHKFYI